MANKEAGERSLKMGEEKLTLKFTTSAYLELEEFLGYSSGKLEQKFREGDVGFKELQGMIWAGTRKYHRRDIMSPGDVAELMDEIPEMEGGFGPIWETVTEAYAAGQGNAPTDGDGEVVPKTRRQRRQGAKASQDQDKPKSSPGTDS